MLLELVFVSIRHVSAPDPICNPELISREDETPMALQNILGSSFDFLSSDEESDAEQSESESEGSES